MSAFITKLETTPIPPIHSDEISEWILEWICYYRQTYTELFCKEPNISGLPAELVDLINKFWEVRYSASHAELCDLYELANNVRRSHSFCYNKGKIDQFISYIASCLCYEVRAVMDQCGVPREPVIEQKEAPIPEWAIQEPVWAQDDEDDQVQGFEETKGADNDFEYTGVPSLFDYDPEYHVTHYLYPGSDAELFMQVMFIENRFKYSDFVPDRLYEQLPEELREIVDHLIKLRNLRWNAYNSPKEKFEFENTDFSAELEFLSSELIEYMAKEDKLPFAYIYIAKFIFNHIQEYMTDFPV